MTSDGASECEPVTYNRDLYVKTNLKGEALKPDQIAHPCGSMARSVFNGKTI